jgi:4-hydroxy-tetrahydrodipicolinate reductase
VIGTTGDLPMDLIKEYSRYVPVAICSNFSKGINTFKNIIKSIADKDSWKVSMTETHHIRKKDSPSGTAKTLAKLYGNQFLSEKEIISVRTGDVIGQHEITLDNGCETIMIIHSAKTRSLFANGSLNWIRWIIKQCNGLYYEIN